MDAENRMKHPRTSHRGVIILGVLFLLVFVQLALAAPAAAQAFTGGFSPTIINGEADLNGDGVVTGRDDSNAFYGDTSIIDGRLDCDAWAGPNDGASDFAWSTIDGRVDSNGDEMISGDDCHFGLIGETVDAGLGVPTDGADILGNPGANECGFANPPDPADDGLVDLNSDGEITAADSCTNGCFFGHNVQNGFVMQLECPGFEGDPRNDVRGTAGNDTLVGTGGADIICGLGGHDTLLGRGGNDVLLGGAGEDSLSGGGGRDRLFGQSANDLLLGGARGNDVLRGGFGNDHLDGGSGFDGCSGGPGSDTFVRCEA